MQKVQIPEGKKVYFNSDYHLGSPDYASSRERERKVVSWLNTIEATAHEIYLLGDLFDFWFEYKTVVPKGFVRLLGKLADLTDKGIKVTIFTGNHDLWMRDYLEKECGVSVHVDPLQIQYNDKQFFIHHGDGKGPGDKGYKRLKKIFTNSFFQWCFHWLHPDVGIGIAQYFSNLSSSKTRHKDAIFLGEQNEWLAQYVKKKRQTIKADYFVFGHRHLPLEIKIGDSWYINLGDWISHFTYAEFDGTEMKLKSF